MMRTQTTVTGLSPAQWDRFHVRARPSYTIEPGHATVCAVFVADESGEERHVEMPVQEFATVLVELAAVERVANLAPARLSFLPSAAQVRNLTSKEAADLARLMNTPCEHGSPVVSVSESQFEGAPPVRIHGDGCQAYGPYAKPEPDRADADAVVSEIIGRPFSSGPVGPPLPETLDPATGRYTVDTDEEPEERPYVPGHPLADRD